MPIELTAETFLPVIARGTCLVVWYAPWSGPWQAFSHIYAAAAQRYPSSVFAQIDAERERELAARCGIDRLPTLMAFRRGTLAFVRAGFQVADSLDLLVRALLLGKTGRFVHN